MSTRRASRLRPILTAAAAGLGGLLAWWRFGGPWFAGLAIVTGLLLVLALISPRAYAPVFAVLERVVQLIPQVFTVLLLGLVFVLIFIPGRIALTVLRRDPLGRRLDPARETYWREIPPPNRVDRRFRAQF